MPWNKLYRTEYAQQVPFDTQYTLGEDLQFVLDYIALLGSREPAFTYTVLTAPLTFYDCRRYPLDPVPCRLLQNLAGAFFQAE